MVPPPAATAAFSSARSPGVVLRVSRIRAPVPSTAFDEARGERGDAREMAEEVERGALGGEQAPARALGARDRRGDVVAPLALRGDGLEPAGARLAEDLAGDLEAEDHPGLPSG